MRGQYKKITIYMILYTIGFLCFFLVNMLRLTYAVTWWDANIWKTRIRWISYVLAFGPCLVETVLLLISSIRDKKWPKELLVTAGMGAVAYWTYRQNGSLDSLLFMLFMLVPFLLKIPVRKVLPVIAAGQILFVIIVFLLSRQDIIMYELSSREGAVRHYFGFTHPTHGPILFLFAGFLLLTSLPDRGRKVVLPILLAFHVLLYRYCDARTCFFTACAFTLGTCVLMAFPKVGKWTGRLSLFIMPAVLLFSFLSPFMVSDTIPATNTFIQRLFLARNGLQTWPVTLFGQRIKWVGAYMARTGQGAYNFVDNHYVSLLLEYGIVYFLLILAVYGIILVYSWRTSRSVLNLAIMLILLFAVMEPRLWQMTFNAMPLFFGEAVYWLLEGRGKEVRPVREGGFPDRGG